jgi:exosortase/archaeosortase family protein
MKTKYIDELIGVSLCLVAFLLYWYGTYTFYPLEYHLLSLPIFVMGITLILFNLKALVTLIFPILFLLFLVPIPSEYMYTIGGAMGNFNTQASYAIVKTLGLPVSLSSTYGTPTIMLTTSTGQPALFTIDLPCSGIYSLIAFAMFAAFLAFVASAPVFKKALVFVIGFFMFEILNVIRIASIVSIAYWFGEAAWSMFHTVAGLLLIFVGMLLTLFVAEKFLKVQVFSVSQESPQCPECKTSLESFESFCLSCGKFLNSFQARISQKFWVKIFLLLLGCSIVTLSIHAPTFAVAQGSIGVTSGWENANVFPQTIQQQDVNYTLHFLYRDENYERTAHQDASLMYGYFPSNTSKATMYVDVGVSSSISNLHSWEVCLITWRTAQGLNPLVTTLESRDMQLLQDVSLIARYLVFEDSQRNYTQVTLYWFERATFNMGITIWQKYVRISLVILMYNSTNYQQFEDGLVSVGQAIASYWEPLKTQSLISLGVPAQQLLLGLSIGFVLITKTVQYSSALRKKSNNLKMFNNFASAQEKLTLQTILDLAKEKKKMKTSDISAAIEQKTGQPTKLDDLLKMLNHLEEYDFIKKDIVSVKNRPMLIWKT